MGYYFAILFMARARATCAGGLAGYPILRLAPKWLVQWLCTSLTNTPKCLALFLFLTGGIVATAHPNSALPTGERLGKRIHQHNLVEYSDPRVHIEVFLCSRTCRAAEVAPSRRFRKSRPFSFAYCFCPSTNFKASCRVTTPIVLAFLSKLTP